MSRLVVNAMASFIVKSQYILISVSKEASGKPVNKLKAHNFRVFLLANHNDVFGGAAREVKTVTPIFDGVYRLTLKKGKYDSNPDPGFHIYGVAVKTYKKWSMTGEKPEPKDHGQTIAHGYVPP